MGIRAATSTHLMHMHTAQHVMITALENNSGDGASAHRRLSSDLALGILHKAHRSSKSHRNL